MKNEMKSWITYLSLAELCCLVLLFVCLFVFCCPLLGRMFRCFILVSDLCSELELKLMWVEESPFTTTRLLPFTRRWRLTRSKPIKGSKDRCFSAQSITCKFSGLCPWSSYKTTLKQQLNGEKWDVELGRSCSFGWAVVFVSMQCWEEWMLTATFS